jgi:uncharacterized membrane protein (DUF2068 family)
MTTQRPSVVGLRTVAAFEAAKGLLVMATGLGLLALVHHDVQRAAETVVRHLHLNPARQYPRVFLEAAANVTDRRLGLLASGAFAYAVVRGVEAAREPGPSGSPSCRAGSTCRSRSTPSSNTRPH